MHRPPAGSASFSPSSLALFLPCSCRGTNSRRRRVAAKAEWEMLYDLAKDKDGRLQKDTVRAVYDGALFYQLAGKKG